MCISTRTWRIISWIFIACGLLSYGAAWLNTLTKTNFLGIETITYFYDAITAGIFGLFFLAWSVAISKKK